MPWAGGWSHSEQTASPDSQQCRCEGKRIPCRRQPGPPLPPHSMNPFALSEQLKDSGNQDFKNGNFSLAIRKYEDAVQILLQLYHLGVPPRELAVLLCNKSNAYYNLRRWHEAFVAAKECLQCDPTYVKVWCRDGSRCCLILLNLPPSLPSL